MAKIYGINGVITGKLGAAVYAVRNGEQISRQYQPKVANPSTGKQIEARAKLKLVSQLSAIMAPVIAMPRVGSVSSRNRFTKVNYSAASYASETAQIDLTAVQLTKSVVSLPPVILSREGTSLTIKLEGTFGLNVSRVVYAVFVKEADVIRYSGSRVVSVAGDENIYESTFVMDSADADVFVYAYGVRDNTEAARVKFGNLTVLTAEEIAKIIVSKTLLESDITLTMTRAAESVPSV